MGLEVATFINDLVTTNPSGGDQKAQGDDHIRLIKTVLKTTFPGLTAAVTLRDWASKRAAVNAQSGTYTLASTDDGKIVSFTLAGAATLNLLAAASATATFACWIRKDNSVNALTVDANGTETINGALTIELGANEGGLLYCTGTAWIFLGLARDLFLGEKMIHRQENDAVAYPGVRLRRSRTTPAANDLGTTIDWEFKGSTGNFPIGGRIGARQIDPVNATEDLELYFETIVAGTRAERLRLGQGLYTPSLTDKGVGTVNKVASYTNGTLDYATDIIVTGTAASPALADHGKQYIPTGAGFTLTLPALAGLFNGYKVGLRNQVASGVCLANRSSTDTITSQGTTGLTAITLPSLSDHVWFIADVTNTRWLVQGKRSFESTAITHAASTVDVQAHSLGVRPKYWSLAYRNVITEGGWAAGDEMPASGMRADIAGLGQQKGLGFNATNGYYCQGPTNGTYYPVQNQSTGAIISGTPADWAAVWRAWVIN